MNSTKHISGFTLIELIVVISLISVLLFFSLPALERGFLINSETRADDINRLVNDLKKRAVFQQIDYSLQIDTISGTVWVTDETMNEEALNHSKENAISLSENLNIINIDFPGAVISGDKEYQIKFRKQGYSDFAVIHIVEDKKDLTLTIEPFLPKVQLINGHISLEDCN